MTNEDYMKEVKKLRRSIRVIWGFIFGALLLGVIYA